VGFDLSIKDKRKETEMSQSKKVEQSKLTQIDEELEVTKAVLLGQAKEEDGQVVWTSETVKTISKEKENNSIVDKTTAAFSADFSEAEDTFLMWAGEKG
jgi:energy-converting hydrogenase A subunit M